MPAYPANDEEASVNAVSANDAQQAQDTEPASAAEHSNVHSHKQPMGLRKFLLSMVLFAVAGAAEIGGGWLVWQTLRVHREWWFFALGAVTLTLYGKHGSGCCTFQP